VRRSHICIAHHFDSKEELLSRRHSFVRTHRLILSVLQLAALLYGAECALAQTSEYEQFRAHNAQMADVQPTWMGPLIQSDARLSQTIRLSVSDAGAPGEQIVSYGNNHGVSMIAERRFQIDFDPPSFFRNHSAAYPDGFGNASAQVKYRISSANAEHGNFAVTAIDFHGFAPRAAQNGMLTAYDCPKIAAGIARGRFDVQSTLGGLLPAAKVAAQGQAIEWNVTAQLHPTAHTWFDVENNAAFNFGGPFDGKTQDFITPAAFYMVRRRQWGAVHPVVVFDTGMQIATSRFHLCNHNLISEVRILF
jgi:hypothetical protein